MFNEHEEMLIRERVLGDGVAGTDDFQKLDDITASAAELNILDNCTATYHDINAGSTLPYAPAFTVAKTAGAANVANLAYTIKDPGGTALTHCAYLMLWLSDSAAGEGITSHAPDQLAIVGSLGSIITEFATDSCALVQCKNDGRLSIAITDTHKTLYKVCLQSLRGEQISIDTLVVGDYGA